MAAMNMFRYCYCMHTHACMYKYLFAKRYMGFPLGFGAPVPIPKIMHAWTCPVK